MARTKGATFRSAVVAGRLRNLRGATGLTLRQAATQMGWDQSKLGRIENAKTAADPQDVGRLLDLYGADTPTRTSLLQLARDAVTKHGWWLSYGDPYIGGYVDMEDAASGIDDFQTQFVPGLLQTPEYAWSSLAIMWPDAPKDEIERMVQIRMVRKPLLTRVDRPQLRAVVDEAVFRRCAAHPEMMAAQVRALLDAPASVTLQVLPFVAGFHAGMDSAFTVLRFDGDLPDKAYIDTVGGEIYVESIKDVAHCSLVFERVRNAALTPEDSAAWLAAFAKELES